MKVKKEVPQEGQFLRHFGKVYISIITDLWKNRKKKYNMKGKVYENNF